MIKKLFIFILLCFVLSSQAQFRKGIFSKDPILNLENWDKQRVYFGFYLGFNNYDFKIDYKNDGPEIQIKTVTGFNVGVVGDLRLNQYFSLRFEPGLYYAQRDLTFPYFIEKRDYFREVKSTYINLPLLVKYSAVRTGNIRPYLLGGGSAALNLSSNSKVKDDNQQQIFRMKPWTLNYEVGFGIDFYLEYFKFSPSIRGVFGINDELVRDNDPNSPWTSNISSLRTQGVFVNFTFH